jgi:hypothetical protein
MVTPRLLLSGTMGIVYADEISLAKAHLYLRIAKSVAPNSTWDGHWCRWRQRESTSQSGD